METAAAAAAAGCGGDELLLSLLESPKSPQLKAAAGGADIGGVSGPPAAAAKATEARGVVSETKSKTDAPTLVDEDSFGHEDAMKEAVGATASLNAVGDGGGMQQQDLHMATIDGLVQSGAADGGDNELFGDEMNQVRYHQNNDNEFPPAVMLQCLTHSTYRSTDAFAHRGTTGVLAGADVEFRA